MNAKLGHGARARLLWWAVMTALLITWLGSGCEDSTLSHSPRMQEAEEDTPDRPDTDSPGDNNGEVEGRCCIMIPLGNDRQIEVDQQGQVVIGVLIFDKETGDPKQGELVEFNLLEEEGGAYLSERSVVTDEGGRAELRFHAGDALRAYVVRATSEVANFVELSLEVKPLPTGDLEISFTNAGSSVYEVAPIEVMAFPSRSFGCDQFRPLVQLPEATFMDEVRDVSRRATFEGLDVREPWTLVAFGRGEFGQVAAAGCQGNVYVREDETTRVEVVLTLLPLNPVGRYEVVSHWNFTETLQDAGPVGQVLLEIFDAFENPGRYLYDQLLNIVREFLGGLVAGAVDFFLDIFGLDDRIEDGINNFIAGVDFLSQVRRAGLDLREMVTRLEVLSTLTIGKIGNDYEVYGADDWRGLAVYWRWNCEEGAPEDCGRIELALDADSSLGVVYGEWTGQVGAYNQLQIRPHAINLRYGQLILYLLNEVILPFLTDGQAHSMVDAILYWINCNGLARSITGSDGEICAPADIVCIHDHQIEGVCTSVIRTVFRFVEVLLGNLEVDSVIELSGEGKLVERDGDLLIDDIIEGSYDGWVNFSGTRSPFDATWSATRITQDGQGEVEEGGQ
jgi:hypothetical protein